MKTYIKSSLTLAVFTFLMVSAGKTYASHSMISELTYRHVTANTYEFTLTFYRNCLGSTATAPPSIGLKARSTSLGLVNASAGTLPKIGQSGGQPATIYNCATATLCIEEYVYRGTVNLNLINPINPNANDWVFYYELCCKPNSPIAFDNVTAGNIYTDCGLNNLDFPAGHNAAIWHNKYPNVPGHLSDTIIKYPFKPVCADRWVDVFQDAKEYDGDIVRYELIHPRGAGGAPEPYSGSYSLAMPVQAQTPPAFEIDSLTGIIHFKPLLTIPTDNIFLVTIKATEYRMLAGVRTEIGFVTRDLSLYYEPASTCPGDAISLDDDDIHLTCVDTAFTVEVTNSFQCRTADANASFIVMTDSASGAPIGVSSVEVNCYSYQIASEFMVNLNNSLSAGTYYLTLKKGTDTNTIISECGMPIPEYRDTVKIIVDSISMATIKGSLDLGGGTLPYINANCGQTTLDIELSAPVQCSSIDPLGSDFILFDSTVATPLVLPITAATPVSCTGGKTNKVTLTFSAPMKSGIYGLYLTQGTDGNTLINICGEVSAPDPIQIRNPELSVNLGPDLQYCKDSLFQALLEAPAGFASYSWNTGEGVRQVIVTTKGTYVVTVGNGYGCLVMDTVIVTEIDCSTGIEDIAAKSFEIYPNPTTGNLYIRNRGKERSVEVSIRSVKGEEAYRTTIMTRPNENKLIDVSTLSKGVYFVHLSDGNQLIKIEKIVLR